MTLLLSSTRRLVGETEPTLTEKTANPMVRSPNSESFRQTSENFPNFLISTRETKKLLPSSSSLFAIKPTLKKIHF